MQCTSMTLAGKRCKNMGSCSKHVSRKKASPRSNVRPHPRPRPHSPARLMTHGEQMKEAEAYQEAMELGEEMCHQIQKGVAFLKKQKRTLSNQKK
jgi:hypothetical protein